MDKLTSLAISYPDFQLNQIIDPEQMDLNNLQIVNKINNIIKAFNELTQGTGGAGNITIAPVPEFSDATTVQQALQQIATFVKTLDADAKRQFAELVQKNSQQDSKITAIEKLNSTQDGRLNVIEEKATGLAGRVSVVEQKNITQDNEINAIKQKNSEQDGRLTTAEGTIGTHTTQIQSTNEKNVEQDRRISEIENREELDNAYVVNIEKRVKTNETNIKQLKEDISNIENVNPSAELTLARTSGHTQETFDTLGKRLDHIEIPLNTDFTGKLRGAVNFRVVDENTTETWENHVKLGNLIAHEENPYAHPNILAEHEVDERSHTDIREKISAFEGHTHTKSEVTDFAHTHTKSEVSDFAHTHSKSEITDLPSNIVTQDVLDEIGLGATCKALGESVDLNTVIYQGNFMALTPTNIPSTHEWLGGWWYLKVRRHNEDYVEQEITNLHPNIHSPYRGAVLTWKRIKSSGYWYEWCPCEHPVFTILLDYNANFNSFVFHGKVLFPTNEVTQQSENAPCVTAGILEVMPVVGDLNKQGVLQRFTTFEKPGKPYTRRYYEYNQNWSEWTNEIERLEANGGGSSSSGGVSLTKEPITLTAGEGITIVNQASYKIGNVLYVNAEIKKTDGQYITQGTYTTVLQYDGTFPDTSLSAVGSNIGWFKVPSSAYATGSTISVTPTKDCVTMRISGAIVL